MSLSGLRKQLNKANQVSVLVVYSLQKMEEHNFLQYLSETVGTAEATKLDEEYVELERVCDRSFVIALSSDSAGRESE